MVSKIFDKHSAYWSDIKEDCLKIIRNCDACKLHKIERHGFHPLTPIYAELPFEHI